MLKYQHYFEVGIISIVTIYISNQYIPAHAWLLSCLFSLILATSLLLLVSGYQITHQSNPNRIIRFLSKQISYVIIANLMWLPYQYWLNHHFLTPVFASLVIIMWANLIIWGIKSSLATF